MWTMQTLNRPYSASVDARMLSQHFDMDNVHNVGGGAGDQISGYIFMCSSRTKPDCFTYRVFGLPASRVEVVEKIKPNTKLFLFDFDLRILYGLYVADSSGKLAIEPYAFGGKFPAQVKFSIFRDCLPMPESAFKEAIKGNYYSGSKFKQELSAEQVNKLVALFRPIHIPLPPRASPLHNALESRHPGYRGSSLQIAKPPPPSHGYHGAGPGYTNIQMHPSLSCVQEAPSRLLRLAHNQVVSMRNDNLISQFVPSHSHQVPSHSHQVPSHSHQVPSHSHQVPSHPHQVYHPDDPVLHQHDTHARNPYMVMKSSSTMIPQVTSANSYYGLAPMPQSNATVLHSKAVPVTPSPTMHSSSLSASQWVSMASEAQTHRGQSLSIAPPSGTDPNASYGSNFTVFPHHYPNEGYPTSYHEPPVASEQVYVSDPNSGSLTTYYSQSQGNPSFNQTYMNDGTNSTTLASGYQYQEYPSYYQTTTVTTDQVVNNVPAHVPETHTTYWATAPSGYVTEQYPITQSTVPELSAHQISGYVPTYSSGANPTY